MAKKPNTGAVDSTVRTAGKGRRAQTDKRDDAQTNRNDNDIVSDAAQGDVAEPISTADMRARAADAGLGDNYTTGVGTGASDVGTGGVGLSDDDIRSDEDPRVEDDAPGLADIRRNGDAAQTNAGKGKNGGNFGMQSNETTTRQAQAMGSSNQVLAAVFDDWNEASRTIDDLYNNGFTDAQIGLMRMNRDSGKMSGAGTMADTKDQVDSVAGGVATGAAVGGVAGLLAALASLTIPGIGPIVAGGVLASTFGTAAGTAIAGAGVGAGVGAAAGGLVGALTGVGLPEDEARQYDEQLRNGATLVTVNAGDRNAVAWRILQSHGGRTYNRDYASTGDERTTR